LLATLWRIERWVEHCRGGLPLLHLDLLRDRGFALGLAAVFCFTFANLSFYLVMMLYLQLGLGLPALQAGSVVLPLALTFALMSRIAGPRAQRLGIAAMLQGCAGQIVGLLAVGIALAGGASPRILAALLIVWGAGQAMVMAPLYGLVLAKVPAAHAGSGGGVISTVQQIGNASGVALLGALYYEVQAAASARAAILASLAALAMAIAVTSLLLRTLRERL